ncbi:hypothetical protein C8A05DRAFT_20595 [Staphylotrichum tortipilum]|uniref:Uncharacterized protein n=1 Tax=Staphylotrichum tortipilum TaxID=2831512 RepID=A0AAN6M9F9_9PEZI|nr:hypothetical protein C8A05DRAFT_20595 [Staphylotrichum longicolle]
MTSFFGDGSDGLDEQIDPRLRNEQVTMPVSLSFYVAITAYLLMTEREKILALKSSMAVRKVRKRPVPPPDTDDEEEDATAAAAEVAEDDAHERKLTSVSLWQVFLYHYRRPEKDEENIKAVYGESVDPHSLEWAEARLRFMNDQKNCKFRVLANMEVVVVVVFIRRCAL